MAKYKFQFETGNISHGNTTIYIKNGIAEVENPTPEIKLFIEAQGGQLVKEEPKAKTTRRKKAGAK